MLKNLLALSFCIIAIKASGELNVVKSPDSLLFKGNEKVDSESLGDILSAAMGNWVDDALKWSGLYIIDPFGTPKNGVVFIVSGTKDLGMNSKVKNYPLVGSSSMESMNAMSSEIESSLVLDFSQLSDAISTITDSFGDISGVGPIKSTKNLKPDLHSEDKEFLTTMAYTKKVMDKYSTSEQIPTLLTIHIPLDPISKAHGEKSPAMSEARALVTNMIENFQSNAKSDLLVMAVGEKADLNRSKREAVDGQSAKDLNLATYYSEDFPVIFNIILWFMVVLGFSILAICYAIGSMDPGRDSIIYRMTSTRMKKDN